MSEAVDDMEEYSLLTDELLQQIRVSSDENLKRVYTTGTRMYWTITCYKLFVFYAVTRSSYTTWRERPVHSRRCCSAKASRNMWRMPPQGVQAGPWEGKSKPPSAQELLCYHTSLLFDLFSDNQVPKAEEMLKLPADQLCDCHVAVAVPRVQTSGTYHHKEYKPVLEKGKVNPARAIILPPIMLVFWCTYRYPLQNRS